MPRRPRGGCPATPGGAGSGRRGGRTSARPTDAARRRQRQLTRPRRRTARRACQPCPPGPTASSSRRPPRRPEPEAGRRRRCSRRSSLTPGAREPASIVAALGDPDDPTFLGRCGTRRPHRGSSRSLVRLAVTPTRFPAADELEGHPRAGVCLAGPGRPLDRQDRLVEAGASRRAASTMSRRAHERGALRRRVARGGRRRISSRTAR